MKLLSYTDCALCPRQCHVDRTKGALGFCKMPAHILAARAAPHFGEEPVISGTRGSGTVFFSGCTLRCIYCQNEAISSGGFGKELSEEALRAVFDRLIDQNHVHNISLVTPTHFLPSILPALEPKLPVPLVCNCGGYERVQTLQALEGKVDVYLPDLKYSDNRLAEALSNAKDYFEIAKEAISEMYRQVGPYQMENGLMTKGVLIRHLLLPGEVGNALDVCSWIAETFPPHSVLFSLLRQYTPMPATAGHKPLDRPPTDLEYDAVLSWIKFLNLEDVFIQEKSAIGTGYIPCFDGCGLS